MNDPSKGQTRSLHVLAAWASPLAAAVVAAVFWLWIANYVGERGKRPPAVLLLYIVLLVTSGVGFLAGAFSLWGIRTWRDARSIVPGALLGIGVNGFNGLACLYAYALEGKNLGG